MNYCLRLDIVSSGELIGNGSEQGDVAFELTIVLLVHTSANDVKLIDEIHQDHLVASI